ncbi:hypothetical protein WISP_56100 [Willisornis vidua]|uniref:Uncharacterized protein n=1 Tax=Willisornis vidua TaxID=1566151 RepID=A0ABQ9DI00_9PASS|nr:hypothetical protein WISP_56100 [Willisornis vidua]
MQFLIVGAAHPWSGLNASVQVTDVGFTLKLLEGAAVKHERTPQEKQDFSRGVLVSCQWQSCITQCGNAFGARSCKEGMKPLAGTNPQVDNSVSILPGDTELHSNCASQASGLKIIHFAAKLFGLS